MIFSKVIHQWIPRATPTFFSLEQVKLRQPDLFRPVQTSTTKRVPTQKATSGFGPVWQLFPGVDGGGRALGSDSWTFQGESANRIRRIRAESISMGCPKARSDVSPILGLSFLKVPPPNWVVSTSFPLKTTHQKGYTTKRRTHLRCARFVKVCHWFKGTLSQDISFPGARKTMPKHKGLTNPFEACSTGLL